MSPKVRLRNPDAAAAWDVFKTTELRRYRLGLTHRQVATWLRSLNDSDRRALAVISGQHPLNDNAWDILVHQYVGPALLQEAV